MPEAAEGLVDYFRCISGEHPDWEEYREAMRIQDKSLIRITLTRWGPIATGGLPADVAARPRRMIRLIACLCQVHLAPG